MVFLGGVAVSYERGTPVDALCTAACARAPDLNDLNEEPRFTEAALQGLLECKDTHRP
jgi:hypothetical protein